MKKQKRLSIKEREEIVNRILNTKDSYPLIAKDYGVTPETISYQAKKVNISREPNVTANRKDFFNQSYFSKIDTEQKAYWLGFITADGCISYSTDYYKQNDKPNRLFINISEKDINLLYRFKEDIDSSAEIVTYIPQGTYAQNPMSKIVLNSIKMCSDLAKYNISPNKTGSENFPTNLKACFVPHFIRGFLDGDGSVYISKNKLHVSVTSSYQMLESLSNIFNKSCNTPLKKICKCKNKNAYAMGYSCSSAEKILNWIYKNATIYLKRKKDIYDLFFSK